MLVVASMLIWGTQVTALQFFGYSIALGGMVYYRLGYDQIKSYAQDAGRQWAEFGSARPALRRLVVLAMFCMTLFVLFGGLAPSYAPGMDHYLTDAANKMGITRA